MKLSFHGGAGTVTGSRHLLDVDGVRILVDAGLFQGLKHLRRLNWKRPSFDPESIDRLFLTHTHIDHAGYLPRLVKEGLHCPVYCTKATRDLAELLLLDSAHIQEEDARYANRKGFSKHKPAMPLYTSKDVHRTLELFKPVRYGEWIELPRHGRARFLNIGHILGSAMVEMEFPDAPEGARRLVFSGDVGRYDMPLHPDPSPRPPCDILVVESTYGDRDHKNLPFEDQIEEPFKKTFARGGVVLIPSFAVGRAQQVTLILRRMMEAKRLPQVPIHIDSPMSIDATEIYSKYLDEHNLDDDVFEDGRSRLFPRDVFFSRTVQESKELNVKRGARIILSSSGMMTAGRILHHLRNRLPHRENLICVVGYQAAGTRGRDMIQGAKHVRIHGQDIPVKAELLSIGGLSGHADRGELLRWIRSQDEPPRRIFVVHGEEDAAAAFSKRLIDQLGIRVEAPGLGDSVQLP